MAKAGLTKVIKGGKDVFNTAKDAARDFATDVAEGAMEIWGRLTAGPGHSITGTLEDPTPVMLSGNLPRSSPQVVSETVYFAVRITDSTITLHTSNPASGDNVIE